MHPSLRPIGPADADTVASLHTISWQHAYRGMLRDDYLDHEAPAERQAVWRERLLGGSPAQFGYLALADGRPAGFIFARENGDPAWGTLIDNIHVLPELKGQGIGRLMVAAIGREAQRRCPDAGVFLWVIEQNLAGRGFYTRLGGQFVERAMVAAPDGGEIAELRVAWPSPRALLQAAEPEAKHG